MLKEKKKKLQKKLIARVKVAIALINMIEIHVTTRSKAIEE
jgi:hypothetical protein